MNTYNDYTALPRGVIKFEKMHKNVQKYHLLSYWFVNIYMSCTSIWGMFAIWFHQCGYVFLNY